MTLYDLTSDALALMQGLNDIEATDETRDAAVAAFLAGASESKLESYAHVMRTLDAEAAAFKAEAERFADKAAVAESGVKRLKAGVLAHLQALGVSEAKAGLFRFAVTANGGKVPVVLHGEPPVDYQRVSVAPDLEKIRAALEAGGSLPFAEFGERGCHVRLR